MPRSASAPPTKRGAQTRPERRSMARSIVSAATETGTDLRTKPGIMPSIALVDGCSKLPRTRSVSMNPK